MAAWHAAIGVPVVAQPPGLTHDTAVDIANLRTFVIESLAKNKKEQEDMQGSIREKLNAVDKHLVDHDKLLEQLAPVSLELAKDVNVFAAVNKMVTRNDLDAALRDKHQHFEDELNKMKAEVNRYTTELEDIVKRTQEGTEKVFNLEEQLKVHVEGAFRIVEAEYEIGRAHV